MPNVNKGRETNINVLSFQSKITQTYQKNQFVAYAVQLRVVDENVIVINGFLIYLKGTLL